MLHSFSDGSEAVFYLSRNPDSKHWVVQLQAGGSCGTYDSCLDRSKGLFGSSRNYSDFMTGTFVVSDDPGENPMFSSWNKVFVPYCRYSCITVCIIHLQGIGQDVGMCYTVNSLSLSLFWD